MQSRTTKRSPSATLPTVRRGIFVALAAMMLLSCAQKQDPAMSQPDDNESHTKHVQRDAHTGAGDPAEAPANHTSTSAGEPDSASAGTTPSDSPYTAEEGSVNWDKMDVALRGELRTLLPDSSTAVRVVFAQVRENSDPLAAALDAQGIQIQTRAGTVWTLRGQAWALAQASSHPGILRMELSQQRRIP